MRIMCTLLELLLDNNLVKALKNLSKNLVINVNEIKLKPYIVVNNHGLNQVL